MPGAAHVSVSHTTRVDNRNPSDYPEHLNRTWAKSDLRSMKVAAADGAVVPMTGDPRREGLEQGAHLRGRGDGDRLVG